jgi:small subunit ribosomal protein S21
MLIVEVKPGEPIDKALKKLKRKFESTKALRELRSRKEYTKPSEKRRAEVNKAIYKQKKNQDESSS